MKRLSMVVTLVFVLGLLTANAQEEKNKISIGVHGNSGLSWMSTELSDYESQGLRFSYGYGANIDYRFAKNYYIGTGFDVNHVGGKFKYPFLYKGNTDTAYGELHRKYKVQYLDIPINLTLKTKEIGYFTYFVQMGFVGSLRLSAYADDEFHYADNSTVKTLETENLKDTYNFMKAGFNVGLGTEFNLNNNISFYGKVFYHNCLTDVLGGENDIKNDAGTYETIKEEAKLNNVGITIGILF